MLNTMSVDGAINEVSYLYAIEKWVNNVRVSFQSSVNIKEKESDSEVCIITLDHPIAFSYDISCTRV